MNKSIAALTFIYFFSQSHSVIKAAGTIQAYDEIELPEISMGSSAASTGLLEPEQLPSVVLEPQPIDSDINSKECLKIMLKNRREIYEKIKSFGQGVLIDLSNPNHQSIQDLFKKRGEANEKLSAILEVFEDPKKLVAFVELARNGGYPGQFYSVYVSYKKILDMVDLYDQAVQGWLIGKELLFIPHIKLSKDLDSSQDETDEDSGSVIIHQSDNESTEDETDDSSSTTVDSVNEDALTEDDESETTEDEDDNAQSTSESGCVIA